MMQMLRLRLINFKETPPLNQQKSAQYDVICLVNVMIQSTQVKDLLIISTKVIVKMPHNLFYTKEIGLAYISELLWENLSDRQ